VGYLGQGLIGSPASIVMCSEMISYVKRILRGFEITPECLAVDLIREVGPGGNFLAEPHTLEFMRKEHWVPRFINRDNPEAWDSRGRPAYLDVITQKAKDVLHNHRPLPLSEEAANQIEKIYRQAEDALTDRFLSA
ncbi:MAG: trimethylamine methyltransferase family protein, partial [Desulfobacterales bacterium]